MSFKLTVGKCSILNIDAYEKEDLEKIVENIGVEETYRFTYQKRSPRRQSF